MVVHLGEAQILERKVAKPFQGALHGDLASPHPLQKFHQRLRIHRRLIVEVIITQDRKWPGLSARVKDFDSLGRRHALSNAGHRHP